jgi:hypothetical protein
VETLAAIDAAYSGAPLVQEVRARLGVAGAGNLLMFDNQGEAGGDQAPLTMGRHIQYADLSARNSASERGFTLRR